MRRFRSLLSGVSAVAVLAALGSADPALAAQTVSGPLTSPPIVNSQPDSVTINLDATVDEDVDGISFFNGKSMTAAGANLTVDDSYLLGDIVNESFMTSGANAIDILNDSQIGGAIFNSGSIDAVGAGIAIDVDSTVAGGIENTGTITGATGILLDTDSEIFGGITNSGLISGAYGINVADANAELHGGIHNEAAGSIVGTSTAAIQFDGTIFAGGITNAGLIQGTGGADGIVMTTGDVSGGITNEEGGVIEVTGTSAVAVLINGATFVGDISNSGQILGENTSSVAVAITGATVFTGSIVNNGGGLISASSTAVQISNTAGFTGDVSNSGSIVSHDTDAVSITATAFTGDLINTEDGVITGADRGVFLNGTTFAGDLTNDGAIGGSTAGVFIGTTNFNGDVTNNGVINATTAGIVVDVGTTVTGDITNGAGGKITAGAVGIQIDGIVTGTIVNAGTIDPTTGILVNGQVNGGITNSGTILGDTNAISLAPANTATAITQTAGLIRGNNGAVTTALRLDQTGAEFVDRFNGDGGTLDGNIVGGGTDDVVMTPASGDSFAYLRGTASGLDQFDMQGAGTAYLGANARGATGATNAPGVTVNAVSMTFGGEGRLYIDDDTTVNLSGAYTQTDGTLEFQLTSDTTPGTYGQIAAGSAALGGNIAAYIQGDTFASVGGNTFTYQDVITGTTSGTFTNAGTIDVNSLFFEGEAIVNASNVDLVLTRLSFVDALALPGLTQNQQAVGGALDTIYDGGAFGSDMEDLFNYLLSLPAGSEEDVEHIYDELGGAEHADIQEIGLRAGEAFVNAIDERLDDMKSGGHSSAMASLGLRRYAEAEPMVVSDASPAQSSGGLRGTMGMSVWGRGYGAWSNADGDEEAVGYDQDTGGFAGGLDFAVDHNWKVGGAIGWSSTSVDFATAGDEADIDGFQFAAYAAFEQGHFYADALLGAGFHDISSTRLLELGFTTEVATADYDANSFSAKGELGAVFDAGRIDVQPFVGLGYISSSTDGFAESGAGDFGLMVGDADADSLASTVGLRLSGSWTAGRVRLIPDVEVAWRHEFLDTRQSFSAAFLDDPATQFQIVSSELSRESVLASAGLGLQVTRGLVLFLDYSGSYNSAVNTHAGAAGLRATW